MAELTGLQESALKKLRFSDGNIFLTGGAGSGKSFVLKEFVSNSNGKNVVVLAPTGMAALNVGGVTVHRFFELKPTAAIDNLPTVSNSTALTIKGADVFVIDEISMVRADLLDVIDALMCSVTGVQSPFGGKQMVFVGDPFQLPPVVTNDERQMFLDVYRTPFFFQSQAYASSNFLKIELQGSQRQSGDSDFVALLNRIRVGAHTPDDIAHLNTRYDGFQDSDDSVLLTTSIKKVDAMNLAALENIDSREWRYHAILEGSFADGLPTERILRLKTDARIMFVKNDRDGRWVNGSTGTVIELAEDHVKVRIDRGHTVEVHSEKWDRTKPYYDKSKRKIVHRILGSFVQLPIKLAWAITIHKCQGQTLDSALIDLTGTFDVGQAYVALSRCKTMRGMRLYAPLSGREIRVDKNVFEFMYGDCEDLRFQTSSEKMKILRESAAKRARIRFEYQKGGNVQTKEITVVSCGKKEYEGRTFDAVEGCIGGKCITFSTSKMTKVEMVSA